MPRACFALATGLLIAPLELVARESADGSAEPVSVIELPPSAEPVPPQPSEAVTPVELQAVIVTGEKLGRSAMQTASSVSITSAESLVDHGDESVQDLMRRVGNATATDQGRFSIRGISNTGPDGEQLGTPVASVYVDGIALDRLGLQGGLTAAYDVEQIEILRGPQSTSQGRNALAGAVIVRSREPDFHWDANGRARVEGDGGRQYAFAGGGPLSDTLAFRAVYDDSRSDGFVTNVTRDEDDWGRSDNRLMRGRLLWTPQAIEGLRILGTFTTVRASNGMRDVSYVPYSLASQYREQRVATADEPAFVDIDASIASVELRYPFSDRFSLSATTALLDSDNHTHRDSDYSAAPVSTGDAISAGQNLTQELRLNVKDWQGWSGVVGLFAGRFENRYHATNNGMRILLADFVGLPFELGYVDIDQHGQADDNSDSYALFTEFDYAWTERLTATLGLRYDRESSWARAPFEITRADYFLFDGAPGVDVRQLIEAAQIFPGNDGTPAEATYDALLPKLGLRYALLPWLTAFATYAEAYRAGGAEVLTSTGQITTYDPEYTRNYEIGLRAELPQAGLSLGLNLFRIDWRDQQVTVYTEDQRDSYTENAGRSQLYGGELEAHWQPTRPWQIGLSVGVTHSEYLEFRDAARDLDFDGNRFTRSPRFSGALSTRWRGSSGLFASAVLSRTGMQYSEVDNSADSRNDAYTLVDARLGYDARHWSLVAYGRNLLDEFYTTERYELRADSGRSEAGLASSYGDGRRFGLQLEIRY